MHRVVRDIEHMIIVLIIVAIGMLAYLIARPAPVQSKPVLTVPLVRNQCWQTFCVAPEKRPAPGNVGQKPTQPALGYVDFSRYASWRVVRVPFADQIHYWANRYGIPDVYAAGLILRESSFQQFSERHASYLDDSCGLSQLLTLNVQQFYGVPYERPACNWEENVNNSLYAGMAYVHTILQQTGLPVALLYLPYNAGPARPAYWFYCVANHQGCDDTNGVASQNWDGYVAGIYYLLNNGYLVPSAPPPPPKPTPKPKPRPTAVPCHAPLFHGHKMWGIWRAYYCAGHQWIGPQTSTEWQLRGRHWIGVNMSNRWLAWRPGTSLRAVTRHRYGGK